MVETMKDKKYTGINRLFKSETMQSLLNKQEDGSLQEFIEDWKWIFGYSKKYKRQILIYTVTGILSSTMGLSAAVLTKYMIDVIVNRRAEQLGLLAFFMIFSTIFSIVFNGVVNRISTKISIYVNNDIQADIFGKVMDAQWQCLNEYSSGDLLNRFSNDIRTVATNAVSWIPDLIIQTYTFLATFIVICYYDITMAVIAFFSAPFLALSGKYILRKLQEYRKNLLDVTSGIMGFQAETFYNSDTIKSFGITAHYNDKLKEWQEKFADSNLKYNLFTIKSNAWMSVLSSIATFAAFAYCLFRLWTGSITYGTMTLFLQQRSKLTSNFESLVKVLPNMVNSSVAAHRVREIAQLPKEQHDEAVAKEMQASAEAGFKIEMRDVSFSYVQDKEVINSSHFFAAPGEIVALVGPSGEGKTTILRMILGLIHPQSGEAVLTAGDGKEACMNADVRTLFSYVPQGNTLLSGSVAENLRLVKQDATEEELIEALKAACAWEFVEKMEGGIYGMLKEKGKGVSEGQAQRIAIARAILRDAPILLLDEATSALDVETERKVLRNIMKQHPNKTCIVSTHRPSVLGMCSRLYQVMDKKVTELDQAECGRLVEDF